jgi:hypothetical protein
VCYGYTAKWYGRFGFAVGCLPAPLCSGLRQKAAEDFPSAPLTLAGRCRDDPDSSVRAPQERLFERKAKNPTWKWGSWPKRTRNCPGAFRRRSFEEVDTKITKTRAGDAPARTRKTSLTGALRRCSIEMIGSDCPLAGALLKNTGPAGRTSFRAGLNAPTKQVWWSV